jgi:heptosyltransferase-3
MSIFVYHAGAIGDCITTIPALRYFNERFGAEPLVLLGNAAFGALAREAGMIRENFDSSDQRFLPLFRERYSSEAGAILSAYSGAILFCDEHSPLLHNVRRSGIERLYTQPPFPGTAMHIIDYRCSLFVDPYSLPDEAKIPAITISPETRVEIRALISDTCTFITIHPGSGSTKKNWPFEKFVTVADCLRAKGYRIVWVKGAAEHAMTFPESDLVLESVSLPHLAGLLGRSCFYVGNDSGITHLAAAVNCPTVAIFGPSDPTVWGPRGKAVTIVQKHTACAPCHRTEGAREACGKECLQTITVDDVLSAISGCGSSTFTN